METDFHCGCKEVGRGGRVYGGRRGVGGKGEGPFMGGVGWGGRGREHRVISAREPSRIPTVASPRPSPPPARHSRKLLSCPCRSRCNTPGIITCTLYVCYPLMVVLRLSPLAAPRLPALFVCLRHSVFVFIFGAAGMRLIECAFAWPPSAVVCPASVAYLSHLSPRALTALRQRGLSAASPSPPPPSLVLGRLRGRG